MSTPESSPIKENAVVKANGVTRGRFAPSPTGTLHVGNLRTALVAWLGAVSAGGEMLVRVEDLDRANSSVEKELRQLADLERIGLTFPRSVWRQSERFAIYDSIVDDLSSRGLTYRCFCSRKEIRDAVNAPHGRNPDGIYPGTCRDLSDREIADRMAKGRPAAIRLRTEAETYSFDDLVLGEVEGSVDDFALRRNDGVPAYNLAVVVDDAQQGITQVVRGDDLASSTPRHLHLQQLLGVTTPRYAHVPLVVGNDGERLAKRHGAVTLDDLAAEGISVEEVVSVLLESLGFPGSLDDARSVFRWSAITTGAWTIPRRWQTRQP
jgi:glutamyl-tRNA synthetase